MTPDAEDGTPVDALMRVQKWLDRKTSFEGGDFAGRLDVADEQVLYVHDLRAVLAAAEFGIGAADDPSEFMQGVHDGGPT